MAGGRRADSRRRRPALLLAAVLALEGAGAAAAAKPAAEAAAEAVLDPLLFEEGFCSSTPAGGSEDAPREINTNTMSCAKLMEFVYAARLKVWERLQAMRDDAHGAAEGGASAAGGAAAGPAAGGAAAATGASAAAPIPPWRSALGSASLASSLLSAHTHVVAAIASQRAECFSEHVRLLLVVGLRRLKALVAGHVELLWTAAQNGPARADVKLPKQLFEWLQEAVSLMEADLRTMKAVLKTWRLPAQEDAKFYSHESDGRYSTMEALRRDTFKEWQMDKGLLRALLRLLPLDSAVGDFGAGSGHYAKWLNDTGLVTAYAFDGSPDIELVTKGDVSSADLGKPFALWRKFDWILCLEVAEDVPADLSGQLLRNLDEHASEGVVLSWARPGGPFAGSTEEAIMLVGQHTTLHFDPQLTLQLRQSAAFPHLRETLLALVRTPPSVPSVAGLAPGCSPEVGWIYAGNDVQMFSDVKTPAACCELCSNSDLCRFWTWSQEETHKDLCWIKASREYRINNAGFISGARIGGGP